MHQKKNKLFNCRLQFFHLKFSLKANFIEDCRGGQMILNEDKHKF